MSCWDRAVIHPAQTLLKSYTKKKRLLTGILSFLKDTRTFLISLNSLRIHTIHTQNSCIQTLQHCSLVRMYVLS